MIETIARTTPKAVKTHWCDYCGSQIQKGETYRRSQNKYDGRLYVWKAHLHCTELAEAIWDFADPDEGMDECTFQDCVRQVMDELYCPEHCPRWDADDGCDKFDWCKCLRQFAEFMKTHELRHVKTVADVYRVWKLVEKDHGK